MLTTVVTMPLGSGGTCCASVTNGPWRRELLKSHDDDFLDSTGTRYAIDEAAGAPAPMAPFPQ